MVNQEIKLTATSRTLPTKSLNSQRSQGLVPAELYGSSKPNQHLFLNKLELARVYHQAGSSSLVDLFVENQPACKVMVQEVQVDPLTDNFNHVDLLQIAMDKEMFAHLPLMLIGESKAVKEHGATLVTPLQEVEISCLPKDLIPHVEVDLSRLNNLGDTIRVKDLQVPSTVKIITGANEVVASAILQKFEAEPVAAAPVAEAGAEGVVAEAGEAGTQTAPVAEAGSPRPPRREAGGEAGKKKSEEKK